jgi:hypothetical protein
MNGPLAQLVALTCRGNAWLEGTRFPAPFFPGHSTCRFCDRVEFVAPQRRWFGRSGERAVAPTPDAWFGWLRATGVQSLRMLREPQHHALAPDRMTIGLANGGGNWIVSAFDGRSSAHWLARWDVWNRDAPSQRIWRVTYRLVRTSPGHESAPDVAAASTALRAALVDIRSFSAAHQCDPFTADFDNALAALDGATRPPEYHNDLFEPGALSVAAARLLTAAQHASVFGGMGSWNDMGFVGDAQLAYERVSEALFRALNDALCAAANSTAK